MVSRRPGGVAAAGAGGPRARRARGEVPGAPGGGWAAPRRVPDGGPAGPARPGRDLRSCAAGAPRAGPRAPGAGARGTSAGAGREASGRGDGPERTPWLRPGGRRSHSPVAPAPPPAPHPRSGTPGYGRVVGADRAPPQSSRETSGLSTAPAPPHSEFPTVNSARTTRGRHWQGDFIPHKQG